MQIALLKKIKELERRSIFLGGPRRKFITAGRSQLELLLLHGLVPDDRVLDVGCGALRGGWWSINFLRPRRYFGIEPNKEMLQAGIEIMLGPELLAEKKPEFSNNDTFDFSVFGQNFDFIIARSIWTHASKDQIRQMLNSFQQWSTPRSKFFASMREPRADEAEYSGTEWVGHSHVSDVIGMALHRFSTIKEMCETMGLVVTRLRVTEGQLWVKISHSARKVSEHGKVSHGGRTVSDLGQVSHAARKKHEVREISPAAGKVSAVEHSNSRNASKRWKLLAWLGRAIRFARRRLSRRR